MSDHPGSSKRHRLEVIQPDDPRHGINMTDVNDAEQLAEQWISTGIEAVTIIATGPNDNSFSIRTLRTHNGQITRTPWRTWINTRLVGDRPEPISTDTVEHRRQRSAS